jgi:chemotaxis protein MotB
MARKKKQEEHENHERWLVSYADFITLLFAFFVVMYSVSSVNEGKYRVLSDALLSAFHSTPKSIDPIQVGQQSKSAVLADLKIKVTPDIMIHQETQSQSIYEGDKKKSESDDESESSGESGDDVSLGKITDDVLLAMANLIELGIINVRKNDLWLEIEINNSILFQAGQAKLNESVIPVLRDLATIIYKFPNSIRIEGYTDSDKISTVKYPSNWELSSARAASIARLFEMSNILPERLSVVGFGPTRPVADNSTIDGRKKNRRVVIVIVANNDIARTVKNKKNASKIPFPENSKLIENGIIEKSDDIHSGPVIDEAVFTGSESSEREISLYRDSISGMIPESTIKEDVVNVKNPALASPIRLFYPIQLPSPFNMDKSDAKNQE